jgi:hypothetical protein
MLPCLSCADSRGEELSQDQLYAVFERYMDKSEMISSSRPFYFHNDEARLRSLFTALEEKGIETSIIPLK